uniref:Uncharacterized protein n=1 Tax=Rangifer tarandus platyrhynchus TaxID=3082113 RepID=A0ACB0EEV8_RANTA|nr:unnamed protein product [Rangifer tarandus platyrhynchus]
MQKASMRTLARTPVFELGIQTPLLVFSFPELHVGPGVGAWCVHGDACARAPCEAPAVQTGSCRRSSRGLRLKGGRGCKRSKGQRVQGKEETIRTCRGACTLPPFLSARDKKHGEGDNARTCRAARSSALDHARSARRDPTRPAPIAERAGARGLAPRRRDAPCVPPPAPVPFASVSVANRAVACSWRVRCCWGAGERGKGRRPPIAALPVRFLWGPELRIDQDEERKERKGKRKAMREGRGALACVPPLGLLAPNAPRLVRGWGGSDTAGSRIWDACPRGTEHVQPAASSAEKRRGEDGGGFPVLPSRPIIHDHGDRRRQEEFVQLPANNCRSGARPAGLCLRKPHMRLKRPAGEDEVGGWWAAARPGARGPSHWPRRHCGLLPTDAPCARDGAEAGEPRSGGGRCPDVGSPGLGSHRGRVSDSPRLGTGHSALTPRLWALDLPSSITTWTPPSLRSSGTYGHLLCARLGERSAHWVPVRKRGILYSWAVGCRPLEERSFHLRDTLGLCSLALMQDPGRSCSNESAAGPSMWPLDWGSWPEAPWTGVSASALSRKFLLKTCYGEGLGLPSRNTVTKELCMSGSGNWTSWVDSGTPASGQESDLPAVHALLLLVHVG